MLPPPRQPQPQPQPLPHLMTSAQVFIGEYSEAVEKH